MMKRILMASVVALALTACGNDNASKDTGTTTNTETDTTTASGNAGTATAPATPAGGISVEDADKGLALVGQSDCLTCHKVEDKLVGPAYREVAAKYPVEDTTIKYLANKIIQGGAGVWGQVPMTPHPQLSQEDAQLMAKYVLSLKQ